MMKMLKDLHSAIAERNNNPAPAGSTEFLDQHLNVSTQFMRVENQLGIIAYHVREAMKHTISAHCHNDACTCRASEELGLQLDSVEQRLKQALIILGMEEV